MPPAASSASMEMDIRRYLINARSKTGLACRSGLPDATVRFAAVPMRLPNIFCGNTAFSEIMKRFAALISRRPGLYERRGCPQCAGTGYLGGQPSLNFSIIPNDLRRCSENMSLEACAGGVRQSTFSPPAGGGMIKVIKGIDHP